MANKTSRFPFTEAKLRALPAPATGRAWHYDSKARGLCVCKTAAGGCSFYFYKWLNGRPARMLLGKFPALSVDQARKAAESAIGDIAGGRDPHEEHRSRRHQPTLQDIFAHWMLYAKTHKKASSASGDKWLYNRYLDKWGLRKLGTIKKVDVQAHHAKVGRENGIYAANRMLALLRSMFYKADEIGYRGDNPAKGIKLFKEQSRDRFLQPHEIGAFFRALEAEPDLFQHFFLLLLFTAARRSNVQAMQWADVDLDGGFWRIPETKGGMAVIVPLVDPAQAILRTRRQSASGPWVFPGRRGGHLTNPKGSWRRICNAANLSDLRPHDVRRSTGSWLAGQGTSLPIIGRLLGHKQAQTTMIYSRLALDPLREALDKATAAMMLAAGGQTRLLEGPTQNGGTHGEENQ